MGGEERLVVRRRLLRLLGMVRVDGEGGGRYSMAVLRVEDGGMEVHKLQVLLDEQGYYSGEEDMEYWFFGTTTENALGTFQASNHLPDTGLTDVGTWRALLGEELAALGPEEALAKVGDGDFPEDLSRQDRVFLIGEGRFEGSPRKD